MTVSAHTVPGKDEFSAVRSLPGTHHGSLFHCPPARRPEPPDRSAERAGCRAVHAQPRWHWSADQERERSAAGHWPSGSSPLVVGRVAHTARSAAGQTGCRGYPALKARFAALHPGQPGFVTRRACGHRCQPIPLPLRHLCECRLPRVASLERSQRPDQHRVIVRRFVDPCHVPGFRPTPRCRP